MRINLYHSSQLRDLEQAIIQSESISSYELMERAGLAAFVRMSQLWPEVKRILVICGQGNNAGDGLVLARLALQSGMRVEVLMPGGIMSLSYDAKEACSRYVVLNGNIKDNPDIFDFKYDLIVDALFGIGLNRALDINMIGLIDQINNSDSPVLSIDIPSGIQADTGRRMGAAVRADHTITFIGLKPGLYTAWGPEHVGEVHLEVLCLKAEVFEKVEAFASLTADKYFPKRPKNAHKGMFGHVLIVGGESGYQGAVALAAEAALRLGSGLVSIATRPEHAAIINSRRPELMCHGVTIPTELQPLLAKANAIVIGPGLGQSDWSRMLLSEVLKVSQPMVVDADALNLIAGEVELPRKPNWILTPHPKEAARLLNCETETVMQDRIEAAKAIQLIYGGVVVLKGLGSLIVDQQHLQICPLGNPGMATAGMGDVLSGVIAALLAQGYSSYESAVWGVHGHAYAADCAASNQEIGLTATDLMPHLRAWINR